MKVCVIGPTEPYEGGISQHTTNIVEAFSAEGHDISFLSWNAQYPKVLYKNHPSVAQSSKFMLSWWNPLTWLKAGRIARSNDVVIVPWVTPFHFFVYVTIMMVASSNKFVVHAHNVRSHEPFPFSRMLTKLFFKNVKKVVCHADAIGKELRDLGYTGEIVVIPHPPNLELTEPEQKPTPPVILVFGFIRDYKGVDIAIEAAGELKKRGLNFRLKIIGKIWDDNPEPYTDLIKKHDLGSITEFEFGYAKDDDVVSAFQDATILLAPYKTASQSGVVPLAFASGTIPVVTNIGGLAETVKHLNNGVIAKSITPLAVADAVLEALENTKTLREGSSASVSTWKSIVPSYLP